MSKNAHLELIALDLIQQGLDTDNREMTNDGLLLARSVIHQAHSRRRRSSILEMSAFVGFAIVLFVAVLAVFS